MKPDNEDISPPDRDHVDYSATTDDRKSKARQWDIGLHQGPNSDLSDGTDGAEFVAAQKKLKPEPGLSSRNDETDEIRKSWGEDDNAKKPTIGAFYKEKAKYAFARRYFYQPDESNEETEDDRWENAGTISKVYKNLRNKLFGERLVKDVLNDPDLENILPKIGISCYKERIQPFKTTPTPEATLAALKFIALNEGNEVKGYKEHHVTLKKHEDHHGFDTSKGREAPRNQHLIFVLGSSGSGKTFLALELADTFQGSFTALSRATLYFHPAKAFDSLYSHENDFEITEKTGVEVVRPLVDWIRLTVAAKLNMNELGKLGMHLSVVLDEAGTPTLCGLFDKMDVVNALIEELEKMATEVLLIITGTGVGATAFSSQNECLKFRLAPWKSTDLLAVMMKKHGDKAFPGIGEEDVSNVIQAIYRQPTLAALSTNARSAAFLLDCIRESSYGLEKPDTVNLWILRFEDIKRTLVNNVVAKYSQYNGIANLKTAIQKRRVAASVLHFLFAFRKNPKQNRLFVGLQGPAEQACAPALIDYNVEGWTQDGQVEYARKEYKTPATMTPALVIVVCAMLGVQTEILSSFEAQEVVTALYALGQQASNIIETYRNDIIEANKDRDKEQLALENQVEQLLLVEVCRMTEHVPVQREKALVMRIPKVSARTIWLNKPLTPGPDIVAYRLLGQAKYSENRTKVVIFPWKELEKCGLLSICQQIIMGKLH
jgi:hypothetical protein